MDNTVGINDIVSTKDGQTLRILAVKKNGNEVMRLEGINDNDPSPMRTTILKENFLRILKKCPWRIDPKTNKKVDAQGNLWIEEVKK